MEQVKTNVFISGFIGGLLIVFLGLLLFKTFAQLIEYERNNNLNLVFQRSIDARQLYNDVQPLSISIDSVMNPVPQQDDSIWSLAFHKESK